MARKARASPKKSKSSPSKSKEQPPPPPLPEPTPQPAASDNDDVTSTTIENTPTETQASVTKEEESVPPPPPPVDTPVDTSSSPSQQETNGISPSNDTNADNTEEVTTDSTFVATTSTRPPPPTDASTNDSALSNVVSDDNNNNNNNNFTNNNKKSKRARKRSSSSLNPILPRSPQLPCLPTVEGSPNLQKKRTSSQKSSKSTKSTKSADNDPETSYPDTDNDSASDSDNGRRVSIDDVFPAKTRKASAETLTSKRRNDVEDGKSQNIVVCVRVRPPKSNATDDDSEIWKLDDTLGQITFTEAHPVMGKRAASASKEEAYKYNFDSLLLSPNKTNSLYDEWINPIVRSAMQGYNGTVFAYGQTSSGKTHTMMGNDAEPGIIPLAIEAVFRSIEEDTSREFLLRVSYLEIYNESLRDLLAPKNKDLTMQQKDGKVIVKPLEETFVSDPQSIHDTLRLGEKNRHVGHTDWNERSSRSHAVFTLTIESHDKSDPKLVRASQLNLIDLAGSERATSQDDRRKEGSYINKSLLTLGTVINKLTDEKNTSSHIPYRDSKLTRLLQTSLGGNARVAVICTVSPDPGQATETVSTLNFARRAKMIVTKPERSTLGDGHSELVQGYLDEIKALKDRLAAAEDQQNHTPTKAYTADKDLERLDKAEEEIQKAQGEASLLRRKLENMSRLVLSSASLSNQSPTGVRANRGRSSLNALPSINWTFDKTPEEPVNHHPANSKRESQMVGLGLGTPLKKLPTSRSISNTLDAIDSPRYLADAEDNSDDKYMDMDSRKLMEAASTVQQAKLIADAEKKVKAQIETLKKEHKANSEKWNQERETLLKEQKENDEKNANELKSLLKKHDDKVEKLEKQHVSNIESIKSKHKSHIESLKKQYNSGLEKWEKERVELSNLVGNLRSQIVVYEQDKKCLRNSFEESNTWVKNLEKELKSLKGTLAEREKNGDGKLSEKSNEIELLRKDLDEFKKSLSDNQKSLTELTVSKDNEIQKLKANRDELQKELGTTRNKLNCLERESENDKIQWNQDCIRLERLSDQNKSYRSELEQIRQTIAQKNTQLKDLEDEIETLKEKEAAATAAAQPKFSSPREPPKFEGPDIKSLRDRINAAAQRSARNIDDGGLMSPTNPDFIISELRAKVSELEDYIQSVNPPSLTTSSTCSTSSVLSPPLSDIPPIYMEKVRKGSSSSSNANNNSHNDKAEVDRMSKIIEGQKSLIEDLRCQISMFRHEKEKSHEATNNKSQQVYSTASLPSTPDNKRNKSHLRELSINSDLGSSGPTDSARPSTPTRIRNSTSSWAISVGKTNNITPSSPEPLPTPPNAKEARRRRRITIEQDMAKLEASHAVEKNRSSLLAPKEASPKPKRVLSGMQYLKHKSSFSMDSSIGRHMD